MPTIEQTIEFIKMAHAGQTDQSGLDYYHHPIDVMNHLPHWASDDLKKAALLHDTPEDTEYKRSQLEVRGYSTRTLDIVDGVTNEERDPSLPELSYEEKIAVYHAHIDHIIETGDEDVIVLKHTDMGRNFSEERLTDLPADKEAHFRNKYGAPYAKLSAAVAIIAKKYPTSPVMRGSVKASHPQR